MVGLVGHVDGFSQRLIDEYAQRLMDNNINGAVLASCDLAELKPVLQMAFGDWVIFRSMIESLRYREENSELTDPDISPPAESFIRSMADDVSKTETKNTTVGVVESAVSSSKKGTASDMTLTSVSNSDAPSAGQSRSAPMLKDPPSTSRDVTDDGKAPVTSSGPVVMNRQDSFVNEVLMESETLREFIQASYISLLKIISILLTCVMKNPKKTCREIVEKDCQAR